MIVAGKIINPSLAKTQRSNRPQIKWQKYRIELTSKLTPDAKKIDKHIYLLKKKTDERLTSELVFSFE